VDGNWPALALDREAVLSPTIYRCRRQLGAACQVPGSSWSPTGMLWPGSDRDRYRPGQLAEREWSSGADHDPEQARQTRAAVVPEFAETRTILAVGHLPRVFG
jgi:hypothetical protein